MVGERKGIPKGEKAGWRGVGRGSRDAWPEVLESSNWKATDLAWRVNSPRKELTHAEERKTAMVGGRRSTLELFSSKV